MKALLFILLTIAILPIKGNAQLFGNQNKKMIANNTEQISLLKTYSDYLDKGLTIAHEGLDLTNTFKNGEFGLHSLYYNSLLQINPDIQKYPLVGQTMDLYEKMGILQTAINSNITATDMLSTKEKQSLKTLVIHLMAAASIDMEELNNILTNGKYQLTDDERIKRMSVVYERVLAKNNSLGGIAKRIDTIIQGRTQQKANTKKIKQLYGKDG